MNQLRVIIAAFFQEWKSTVSVTTYLAQLSGIAARSAALAWIASQSENRTLLTYIYIGAPLMAIWFWLIWRVGWSLNNEIGGRTLDFTLISRAPVVSILFGKTLSQVAYFIPAGIIAFITVFLVSGELPEIADVRILPFSLLLVIIGIVAASLLFSPFIVLIGGQGGFFNALMPFGAVLCGFIMPVERLPIALEVVARCLPTSWAMESIWLGVESYDSLWLVIRGWGMSILLSVVLLGATYLMCNAVMKRIRVTGTLGIY
jgi:ABC-type multidrug transport system permease subunit